MRFIGVVMIFCCCAGGGLWLSEQLSVRVRHLASAERMLTDMIGMVRNQNLPTGEILSRLGSEYPIGETADAVEALEKFAADPLFRPEERVILIRVGQLLGTSDRESQVNRLELERESLRRFLRDAEEDRNTRGKLFRTVGLLVGAMTAVLAV